MRPTYFAVAAGIFLSSLAARADLIGDTIHASYVVSSGALVVTNDLGNFTVPGSGHGEFNEINFEFTATQVIFTSGGISYGGQPFNGYVFTDLSKAFLISGVNLNPVSSQSGIVASITANSLTFNFSGVQFGSSAVYDLTFAPSSPPPSSPPDSPSPSITPEPSSFALLGTGLLGAIGAARRRMGSAAI